MQVCSWSSPVGAVRAWNGDFVVYNPLSGHTHILDLVAGAVLTELAHEARSADYLCKHLGALLDMPADAALATRVGEVLDHLDDIGLAEPVC